MIVSRYEASRLAKGAVDELHLPYLLEKGTVEEVRAGIRQLPTCRVRVEDWWEHKDQGFVHRVRVVWLPAEARLLAARPRTTDHQDGPEVHGYTNVPALSLWDAGECVPEEFQKHITQQSDEIWRETELLRKMQRFADVQKRSQSIRLAEAKRQARLKGIDVSNDERVIQERIERMERKVAREDKADEAA